MKGDRYADDSPRTAKALAKAKKKLRAQVAAELRAGRAAAAADAACWRGILSSSFIITEPNI
ncbi:MAG: hypothetical protein PHS14_00090 [Elusimicrobia bacterium]|nr:hypothetical protein [Elusimicrobiota bacterium]